MSSTQEGTTLILASVAVCLLIYVMNQEYRRPSNGPRLVGILGSVKNALGTAPFVSKLKKRMSKRRTSVKDALGARRARVDKTIDCSKVSPSDTNWARCAQGAAVARVPTTNAGAIVDNTTLAFAADSLRNQGLGTNLVQDEFIRSQYDQSLGGNKLGGMRIDPGNQNNNAFFSEGTENPTLVLTSQISPEGAAAFPFARRSDDKAEASTYGATKGGVVPGKEAVGMGMKIADFTSQAKEAMKNKRSPDGPGRGTARQQVAPKLGVAPFEDSEKNFNPFVGSGNMLGNGLGLSEAFKQKNLGTGSSLKDAFGSKSLGAAVSPVKSDLGVSQEEIVAATSNLENVNIVQSTTGGRLDFGIRP